MGAGTGFKINPFLFRPHFQKGIYLGRGHPIFPLSREKLTHWKAFDFNKIEIILLFAQTFPVAFL